MAAGKTATITVSRTGRGLYVLTTKAGSRTRRSEYGSRDEARGAVSDIKSQLGDHGYRVKVIRGKGLRPND